MNLAMTPPPPNQASFASATLHSAAALNRCYCDTTTMLLQLLLLALSCAVALAELPWRHLYRDTRALLPSDQSNLSVSSNVSASFAAIDPTHARVMQPLLQQLHSDSVVWDIGAGIGTVSLHAARRGARAFAFEWDPVLLQDLRASAPRN